MMTSSGGPHFGLASGLPNPKPTAAHVARTSRNKMITTWDLHLLGARMGSFAHLLLGLSNHNKVVL